MIQHSACLTISASSSSLFFSAVAGAALGACSAALVADARVSFTLTSSTFASANFQDDERNFRKGVSYLEISYNFGARFDILPHTFLSASSVTW